MGSWRMIFEIATQPIGGSFFPLSTATNKSPRKAPVILSLAYGPTANDVDL